MDRQGRREGAGGSEARVIYAAQGAADKARQTGNIRRCVSASQHHTRPAGPQTSLERRREIRHGRQATPGGASTTTRRHTRRGASLSRGPAGLAPSVVVVGGAGGTWRRSALGRPAPKLARIGRASTPVTYPSPSPSARSNAAPYRPASSSLIPQPPSPPSPGAGAAVSALLAAYIAANGSSRDAPAPAPAGAAGGGWAE